jgi:hypothetical protein
MPTAVIIGCAVLFFIAVFEVSAGTKHESFAELRYVDAQIALVEGQAETRSRRTQDDMVEIHARLRVLREENERLADDAVRMRGILDAAMVELARLRPPMTTAAPLI